MSSDLRVLVVGDVNGRLTPLFKKIRTILLKNGQFDAVFCVGSFFGEDGSVDDLWASLQDRSVSVPCPTYIMGPVTDAQLKFYSSVPYGGEIVPNLTFIGRTGVHEVVSGLRVCVLNGRFDQTKFAIETATQQDKLRSYYVDEDVRSIMKVCSDKKFKPVDLLLTARWPDYILENQEATPDTSWVTHNPGAATVARVLAPRYHFAGGQVFFERLPFRNHKPEQPPKPATRFIGLGPVANKNKTRWIYAFSITPAAKERGDKLLALPDKCTMSPYERPPRSSSSQRGRGPSSRPRDTRHAHSSRAPLISQAPPPQQQQQQQPPMGQAGQPSLWGQQQQQQQQQWQQKPPGGAKRRDRSSGPPAKRPPVTPASCWFCLGSPKVERHLVVSVGKQMYLALPKGPLTQDHVLIIPIQHEPCSAGLSRAAADELAQFKSALMAFFNAQDMTFVMFERHYRSDHMQLQVVPLPKSITSQQIENAFMGHARRNRLQFDRYETNKVPPAMKDTHYFSVELPDGKCLLAVIAGSFPLQFGREVLCSRALLDKPDRIEWKRCMLGKEEEAEEAKALRKKFAEYDPFTKRK